MFHGALTVIGLVRSEFEVILRMHDSVSQVFLNCGGADPFVLELSRVVPRLTHTFATRENQSARQWRKKIQDWGMHDLWPLA